MKKVICLFVIVAAFSWSNFVLSDEICKKTSAEISILICGADDHKAGRLVDWYFNAFDEMSTIKDTGHITLLSALCNRETIAARRKYGKPLPSANDCLTVLELAYKIAPIGISFEKHFIKIGRRSAMQREALNTLSDLYDFLPSGEKGIWIDEFWLPALKIVEPSYGYDHSHVGTPVSRADKFSFDLREIVFGRPKNEKLAHALFAGGMRGGDGLYTKGTCIGAAKYMIKHLKGRINNFYLKENQILNYCSDFPEAIAIIKTG